MSFDGIVDGGKGKGGLTGAEIFNEMFHNFVVTAAVLTDFCAFSGINSFRIVEVTLAFSCEDTESEFVVFENAFDFTIRANDVEETFCLCASANEVQGTHCTVFKGNDNILVIHDVATGIISAFTVSGVLHIFDFFFSCDGIDRFANACPSLEGHGIAVEMDLDCGIVAGLFVRTIEAKFGCAFGSFIKREVFAESKAGYEFRTGFIGKPAHKVHVVAAFCKQKTGAAFFFVVPFSADEGVDKVRHTNVFGHHNAANSADLAFRKHF